jgi:hypothetical protein
MGTLFVDKLDPQSGTSLEIGSSGDTITIPSGCTITNNGTQTGFGENNTPYFIATMTGSDQSVSDNTYTKAAFNSQTAATSGTYDTSNYRFTPAVSGTYLVHARLFSYKGGNSGRNFNINIYKNGSSIASRGFYGGDSSGNETAIDGINVDITQTMSLNTTDYIEVYGRIKTTNGTSASFNTGNGAIFTAQRVII